MILDQISRLDQVLILGFAREGQSTYKFLRSRFPGLIIALADQKTPDWIPDNGNIKKFFGPDYLNSLKIENCKLVIKSPGISPHKPEIEKAAEAGVDFTSHTQIFFEVCPSKKTIGVTGTKGKSTTVSLIYHLFETAGQKSVLVGNIGRPALDFLPEIDSHTWVVTELSSYQLMDLTVSPHIAILLNIVPDHLDYHLSFEEYVEAKRNLVRFQTKNDYFIYNADFPLPVHTADLTPARKLPFSLTGFDPAVKTRLLGNHNKYNILAAIKTAGIISLPKDSLYRAIASFKPLETRLEPVASKKGVIFYADTLATIPEATVAAINTLHPNIDTLIAGGHERRQDYSILAGKILSEGIKNLIVFPKTGPRIWTEIKKAQARPQIKYFHPKNMAEAVKLAFQHTAKGKICLLSPAAPSFTLFKDYKDEYEQYKQAIDAF
jgi:UDP-N-acetylmuramoylalanine--D-glutamate ligase